MPKKSRKRQIMAAIAPTSAVLLRYVMNILHCNFCDYMNLYARPNGAEREHRTILLTRPVQYARMHVPHIYICTPYIYIYICSLI